MSNINKRRLAHPLDLMPAPLSSFCTALGSKTIKECLELIGNGDKFLAKHADTGSFSRESIADYDKILFDVISGLF